MIALFDIGNTHTHIGLANDRRVLRQINIPTKSWSSAKAAALLQKFFSGQKITGAALCSVVPDVTSLVTPLIRKRFRLSALILTYDKVRGIGIDYPRPETIGPDRLANAIAAKKHFGAPSVVVDFGTAVTFDVVNGAGDYAGGIIAPGLNVMTDYLHEKTALLPRIVIRETKAIVGKNTEEAMLIGAVHGYRGLIRELVGELKRNLKSRRLPVVATGGYAKLISAKLPEITAIEPLLTLEGLRLFWLTHQGGGERPCALCDADF